MRSFEVFRFRIKRVQMFMTLFERDWMLGIRKMDLPDIEPALIHIRGFLNIEIGFILGSININIDHA